MFSIQRSSLLSEHLNIKFVRGCREDDQSIVIPKFEAAWPTSLSRLWSSQKWEWGKQWGMRMRIKRGKQGGKQLKNMVEYEQWVIRMRTKCGNNEDKNIVEKTMQPFWGEERIRPEHEQDWTKRMRTSTRKTTKQGWVLARGQDECWFLTRADPTSL